MSDSNQPPLPPLPRERAGSLAAEQQGAARLYHNARREAMVVMVVWALALAWTLGYCYLRGYQHDPKSWVVRTGLAAQRTQHNFDHFGGLPDWVLIGILFPWLLCSAFTVGFCLGMKDDDLGTDAEEGADHGH